MIVYTSADSVLQICGNEETFGLEELYRCCEIARELTMKAAGSYTQLDVYKRQVWSMSHVEPFMHFREMRRILSYDGLLKNLSTTLGWNLLHGGLLGNLARYDYNATWMSDEDVYIRNTHSVIQEFYLTLDYGLPGNWFAGVTTVSYTHLDVYKRQVLFS